MTIENEVIKTSDIEFYEDVISAFQAEDGEIYTSANEILRNIGFNEDRVKAIRKKWRDDRVVSRKGRYFTIFTKTRGPQDTYCISHKILPIALAKISITPELERSYPEVVEKLEMYQIECADVLYRHFFVNNDVGENPPTLNENLPPLSDEIENTLSENSLAENPISREETLLYLTYMNDTLADKMDTFIDTISGVNKVCRNFAAFLDKQNEILELHKNSQAEISDCLKNVVTALKNNSSTLSPEVEKWVRDFETSQRVISRKSKKPPLACLKEAYEVLKKDGIDVKELYKSYVKEHPGTKKLEMCAEQIYLREKLKNAFIQLDKKYDPSNVCTHYSSKTLLSTPENIRRYIEKIAAKNNRTYTSECRTIYKELEDIVGGNLENEMTEFCKKVEFSRCSKAFYVSTNVKYLDMLRKMAEAE
jgi:hypothetical protein